MVKIVNKPTKMQKGSVIDGLCKMVTMLVLCFLMSFVVLVSLGHGVSQMSDHCGLCNTEMDATQNSILAVRRSKLLYQCDPFHFCNCQMQIEILATFRFALAY